MSRYFFQAPRLRSRLSGIKAIVRTMMRRLVALVEPIVAISETTAALYCLVVSSGFRREQVAVLRGKVAYRRSVRKPSESSYVLRRNIHRIEKGLIMEPRRQLFAKDYVQITIDALGRVLELSAPEAPEVQWARGVLDEYFRSVNLDDDSVANALNRYRRLFPTATDSGGPRPFPARVIEDCPVTPEQFDELCKVRRSVRWYSDRGVSRELIDRAIRAAGMAPSACNRQAFKFLVYDDPGLVQKVARIPMGTTGFGHNFPVIVLVVGDLGAYFDERDRHLVYIDSSLAAMTFMYSLRTQGIATCGINWPDIPALDKKMRRAVGIPPHWQIIMLISLGYPRNDGLIPASVKKPLHQLRQYNSTETKQVSPHKRNSPSSAHRSAFPTNGIAT